MYNFTIKDRVFHKIYSQYKKIKLDKNKIIDPRVTIISNNCWGGVCYEALGLQKQSPTVGAYFFSDDYIRFISDLKKYLSFELRFIAPDESKYYQEIIRRGQQGVPIGLLGDVEIVFLHYPNRDLVKEKWERRVERVNWDNLILKFSYMNLCTDIHVHEFEKLTDIKKLCFVNRKFEQYKDTIVMPYLDADGQIGNDTYFWNKGIDIVRFLNTSVCDIDKYWDNKKTL